jgi:hypothetical protein
LPETLTLVQWPVTVMVMVMVLRLAAHCVIGGILPPARLERNRLNLDDVVQRDKHFL